MPMIIKHASIMVETLYESKASALTIPCIGLKIKIRTSTIIKANIFAMHGLSAK